jgi:hypothetical protein
MAASVRGGVDNVQDESDQPWQAASRLDEFLQKPEYHAQGV